MKNKHYFKLESGEINYVAHFWIPVFIMTILLIFFNKYIINFYTNLLSYFLH